MRNVALVVISLFFMGCTDQRIRAQLSEVPGIEEITDFLSYEGIIYADVTLNNGGYLRLNNLREQTFTETDQIYVSQIGNLVIHCEYEGQIGSTSSGHNIVALVSQMYSGADSPPSIKNISQLVERYEYVLALVSLLPDRGQSGKSIAFLHREPQEWECFKIRQH